MYQRQIRLGAKHGAFVALADVWRCGRARADKALICCRRTVLGLLGIMAVALPSGPLEAASPPMGSESDASLSSERVPARLSYISGKVSFWRPGAEDWTQAETNIPMSPGDALYTGRDGNAEVQIGGRVFLRAAPETELGLTNREPDFDQLELKSGRTALDVRALGAGQVIEVDTPHAAFTIEAPGYYRVDVSDRDTTFMTHRGGRARISTLTGATAFVGADEQIVVDGSDGASLATSAAPDLDSWDQWNYGRTDNLIESASARYVSPEVYGLDELDRYGAWRTDSQYGPVWVPAGVAPDWAPYSVGRWVWDPYYGWTWVDAAPWGWAPSHYGRWVRVSGYWGWAPGPIVTAPVYAPAVVAFFGGHNFSVGIGIGAPAVGWVALGWGEPIVPWWGGVGFVGVPWWGGWGGPWVINNVVIYDHHHHHHHGRVYAHDIHDYCHARERHALRFDREDRFGHGGRDRHEWREVRGDQLQPVHGKLRARPTAASLAPGEDRGSPPPDHVRQRRVVATRAGRDNTQRLREAGLGSVGDRGRPAPRIIGSRDREQPPTDSRERPALRPRAREARAIDGPGGEARDRRGAARPGVPSSPSYSGRSVERGPSDDHALDSSRPERPLPAAPHADRPALRERPSAGRSGTDETSRRERAYQRPPMSAPERPNAPAARIDQPPRRDRANVAPQRPAVSSPERARPPHPSVDTPNNGRPALRERSHASRPQLQRQPRSSGHVTEVGPRQMPAPQPRQMRERSHGSAQARDGGQNAPGHSSGGGQRGGGEAGRASHGSSAASVQHGSPQGSSHGRH